MSLSALAELGSERATEALGLGAKLLVLVVDLRQEITLFQGALQGMSFGCFYYSPFLSSLQYFSTSNDARN